MKVGQTKPFGYIIDSTSVKFDFAIVSGRWLPRQSKPLLGINVF